LCTQKKSGENGDGSDYAALGLGLSVAVSDFSRRSATSARFARAQVMNAIMQPNRGPPPTLPPRIAPTPQHPLSLHRQGGNALANGN